MPDDPAEILKKLWNDGRPAQPHIRGGALPEDLVQSIRDSINSATKTYRYVLPAQLLAKICDPKRDARAIQETAGMPGSFDARSFCHSYIVPFDRANHSVLGGSPEPYVNNPLRIPAITPEALPAQRNRKGFTDLIRTLDYAQQHPEACESLMRVALSAIRERLAQVRIVYATPNRMAVDDMHALIDRFLLERTGGRRLQAVVAALFDTIGKAFGLFARVEAGHINRADAAAGDIADLACLSEAGDVVLAVEVKDRSLTIREVEDKLPATRENGIAELLYVIRNGVPPESAAFDRVKQREFASGHNLNHADFTQLLRVTLLLFGETMRRQFLLSVGQRIDEFGELADRQAWRDLLDPE